MKYGMSKSQITQDGRVMSKTRKTNMRQRNLRMDLAIDVAGLLHKQTLNEDEIVEYIATEVECSKKTVRSWLARQTAPGGDNLVALTDLFRDLAKGRYDYSYVLHVGRVNQGQGRESNTYDLKKVRLKTKGKVTPIFPEHEKPMFMAKRAKKETKKEEKVIVDKEALDEANKALGPYGSEIEANIRGYRQGLIHGLVFALCGTGILYAVLHLPG